MTHTFGANKNVELRKAVHFEEMEESRNAPKFEDSEDYRISLILISKQ